MMEALILAAGKGSRLGVITETIPKPMIEYQGKPIIEHNYFLCKKNGINRIFINLHHLSYVITEYFEKNLDQSGIELEFSYEKEILGTSGALKNISTLLQGDYIFVIYGDNFSDINLSEMLEEHKLAKADMSIALFHKEDVSQSGIAVLESNKRIKKFIEKPAPNEVLSHWVNAGIYIINKELIKMIPDGFSDFGKDIIPLYLEKECHLHGHCVQNDVLAFDTEELLQRNIQD